MPLIDVKFKDSDIEWILQDINVDIDKSELLNDINRDGPIETSIQYGAKIDSYRYHQLAGRIGYRALLLSLSSDIDLYVERMRTLLRPEISEYITKYAEYFQDIVTTHDNRLSLEFDYLQFMSHYTSYLTRETYDGDVIETPAQMHLRVTAELFYRDEELKYSSIGAATNFLSSSLEQFFSMASPILFNSGFKEHNLSSCFLMTSDDNTGSIMDNNTRTAFISKAKGGVGMDISNIRDSEITQGGMSQGVVPVMRMIDATIRCFDQNGKRSGACTVFLQAHHIDVLDFIEQTRKTIAPHLRVEILNTAIVFPSLFWKRLEAGGNWTIFCPHKFPGLNERFGDDYERLYLEYESATNLPPRRAKYRRTIKAELLMKNLAEVQTMSGMPYVIHKDNINHKSNRVNLDSPNPCHHQAITSSNLCLEIYEQSSSSEIACCNLGQMSLPRFVKDGQFDFLTFAFMVRRVTDYLNRIIDNSKYPFDEARISNQRHRPIGLGVSGYGDMLSMLGIPYESKSAEILNKRIFACMYFNSLVESLSLAIRDGPYDTFFGSPLSQGEFQFDLWADEYELVKEHVNDVRNKDDDRAVDPSEWGQTSVTVKYGFANDDVVVFPSWDSLRNLIMKYGVRNCQRTAIMPSASTSRLMSNTECIEAHQECVYVRNFKKHSMVIINKHLQHELEKLNLWSKEVAEFIVAEHGSVQRLPLFLENNSPELAHICSLFKTMFEIKQRTSFLHTAQRHRYIDQGISANVYFKKPTLAMIKNFHLMTWKLGINTGMYYLRSSPGGDPDNVAITSQKVRNWVKKHKGDSNSETFLTKTQKPEEKPEEETVAEAFCKINGEGCTSCKS